MFCLWALDCRKPLRKEEATEMRSALCRALYGCLFLRVVQLTNSSIGFISADAAAAEAAAAAAEIAAAGAAAGLSRWEINNAKDAHKQRRELLFCGVLDIFGFECFQQNSFEQLCINYTNERLQQFFNSFVFLCEEQLYKKEHIHWSPLDFPDNADCVALLQDKQTGVFAMLDEECVVPGGSNRGYTLKLVKRYGGSPTTNTNSSTSSSSGSGSGTSSRFKVHKTKQNTFIIKHFAGEVEYCTDGFLEKNKDVLSLDLQQCIAAAENAFVAALFVDFLERGGALGVQEGEGDKPQQQQQQQEAKRRRKLVTVSGEFRDQLQALMQTIGDTNPHFIRCIKPNPENLPDLFHRPSVNEQLRYGGVLQAVQVSRAGYPVRLAHIDAVKEYRPLADKPLQQQLHQMQQHLQQEQQQQSPMQQQMQQQKGWKELAVLLLQQLHVSLNLDPKAAKGGLAPRAPNGGPQGTTWAVGETLCFFKRECFELLSAALVAKRAAAATKIQSRFKGYERRQAFLALKRDTVIIQRAVRCWLARRERERQRRDMMARRIQTFMKMVSQRNKFLRSFK